MISLSADPPAPSLTLAQYRGRALDGARAWADLNPEERRRRAMVAAQHLDAAALWSLTEAHTLLYGHAGASLSPRTARAYREGVTRFVRHAVHAGVSLIRPERDAGPVYARTLEGQGLAPSSVRVHLAAARALYKALRWAEVTALDPFSDTTAAKDRTAAWDKRQPYLEEEVQALLAASRLRDRALILLCAHGGLRIMEALALTWADLQGDALVVRHGAEPSSRRHSSTTAPTLWAASTKRWSCACARATNRATAPWVNATSGVACGGGQASAPSRNTCSCWICSRLWLVTSRRTPGASRNSACTTDATAAVRCSALSSTTAIDSGASWYRFNYF